MSVEKRQLPSKRTEELARVAAEKEQERERLESEFRGVISRLSATDDGKYLFRWLKKESGFGDAYLGLNPSTGEIDPQRTVYAAMRQNLYLKVRKSIPVKQLLEVEFSE